MCVAAIWLALAFTSAWRKSTTVDEVPHLGAGLSVLEFGDFRMNPEHPPLIKVLSALPVYLLDRPNMQVENETNFIGPWFDGLQTEYGWYLLYVSDDLWADIEGVEETRTIPFQRRLMLARSVPILIGLLGGWLAFLWGRELTRATGGGLIAAVMLLFYPEYLGHARFITFDVPTAVSFGALSWVALLFAKRPGWGRGTLFVIVAMLGSQTKLPVTVFVVGTLLVLLALSFFPRQRLKPLVVSLLILATAVGGVFAAWAGAGFRFSFRMDEIDPTAVRSRFIQFDPPPEDSGVLENAIYFAWENRLLPESALATFKHVGSFGNRMVNFNGVWRHEGWYAYFFETFLIKSPIPMVLATGALFLSAAGFLRRGRGRVKAWRMSRGVILWSMTLAMFALMVISKANLGHRYVLFIYFPLSVELGALAWRWLLVGGWKRYAAIVLVSSQLISTFVSWPHYATYFNIAVGTPYEGLKYVADSNLDWGQDVPLAAQAMKEHGWDEVNYAVFGHNRPDNYGIKYRWILDRYPFAVNMPKAVAPDPNLPTISSLNNIESVQALYPGLYDREPDILLNSLVVYLPLK